MLYVICDNIKYATTNQQPPTTNHQRITNNHQPTTFLVKSAPTT